MTHVFVVNERTFNIHLQYLFAGTGYQENDLSCIIDSSASSTEKTLTGMIADISKLRAGDKVLFYVTGCKKIFGVFEVDGTPFYEPFLPNRDNYLYSGLGKNLSFRVMIKPSAVYAAGISEQEALDEIYDIDHPYQMCWSLIYRKLSGMRGCSFLTDYESDRIINLIRNKNHGMAMVEEKYQYDFNNQTIAVSDETHVYSGNTTRSLDILKRMTEITNSFEVHLQAYITQNYDAALKTVLETDNMDWIGNEVVCSVGEQRIDVMLIGETENEVIIKVIELKDEKPGAYIIKYQIPWYIKWVDQYVAPNYEKKVIIKPIIIAAKFRRRSVRQTEFYDEKNRFNSSLPTNHSSTVTPLEYISFEIDSESQTISFCRE